MINYVLFGYASPLPILTYLICPVYRRTTSLRKSLLSLSSPAQLVPPPSRDRDFSVFPRSNKTAFSAHCFQPILDMFGLFSCLLRPPPLR